MSQPSEGMRRVSSKELLKLIRPGQRLLGMDVGDRNIGLAISDGANRVASPHCVLYRKQSAVADNIQTLQRMVTQLSVIGLVIGYPLALSGREGSQGAKTRAFVKELQSSGKFDRLYYIFWDERLTTAIVENAVGALDITGRRRKSIMDKFSALTILQGCLDELLRLKIDAPLS